MLVPAVVYKDELETEFAKHVYDDDMFYYMGYSHGHSIPEIRAKDNYYQWAIVSQKEIDFVPNVVTEDNIPIQIHKVIGYFAYEIDLDTDTVLNFGLYSFDKGNALIGRDVFTKMEELVLNHRRIEWRCIEGNSAARPYGSFVVRMRDKYDDVRVHLAILHEVTKDNKGKYHDELMYEIWHAIDKEDTL